GASGALRQEFRELEMLDDITTLRYNAKLPSSVAGNCRNDLISAFRLLKGEKYVPSRVHQAIRWKGSDPFCLSEGTDIPWKIMEPSDKPKPAPRLNKQTVPRFVPADGTQSISTLRKRKLGDFNPEVSSETALKKLKIDLNITMEHFTQTMNSPRGSQWSNNSCAFDAVMSVLYNIWLDDMIVRTVQFRDINNEYLGQIADSF
ncbi:hypothetical protein BYT27DRAFT_7024928, partial [Phlegmacium glaucopus]